jgi:inorganic triphosphatase YgiF
VDPLKSPPREIELKLTVDPADAGRIKRHLDTEFHKRRSPGRTLVSVYFDTADLRLRHAGLSLRVRRAGRKHMQTIKASAGARTGYFDRAEWECVIKGPQPDLDLMRGTPLESVLQGRNADALAPLFETRIRRTEFRATDSDSQIAVALDQGEVDTGQRRSPLCEVEMELVRGTPAALFHWARRLNEVVPLHLATQSKADRGYELLAGEKNPIDTAGAVHITESMTSQEAFQIIGRECLRHLMANETATLTGNSEGLHQMRVALRRLRAAISVFAKVAADADTQKIKDQLAWITGELGPARDLDTFTEEVLAPFRQQNPKAPGLAHVCRDFAKRRAQAHADAAAAVKSMSFRSLVLQVAEWIEAGRWTQSDGELLRQQREQPIAAHAAGDLTRRLQQIRKQGRKLRDLTPAKRHKFRIRAKKLRYAMEFFADVFQGKKSAARRKAAVSSLKGLQDALGALNDIVAYERLLSQVAPATRRAILGPQKARVGELERSAERAYARLIKTKPFWP